MTTTLQAWGNSQGIRLPKSLIKSLGIQAGAQLELSLAPGSGAIIVQPVVALSNVRAVHKIEDLIALMPKDYAPQETDWGQTGREEW